MFNQSEGEMRVGFVRKVYGILSVQLIATFGAIMLCAYNDAAHDWIAHVPAGVSMFCLIIATIIELMMLCCCRHLTRVTPINYIMLAAFTFFMGFPICQITS
jgi:hypothetical protein